MRLSRPAIALAAVIGWAHLANAQVPARDSAQLVATTRALLDAITSGDSAVWANVLAPGWAMSDEEGNRPSRAEFLASLHGLPAGQHGKLQPVQFHFTGDSTLAVVSYDADEWHDYYGQILRTRFRTTDVWVKRNGRWLELASHVTALPTPIAGADVPRTVARTYTGEYELTPGIRMQVAGTDSGLVLGRAGRPPQRLRALDDRIFVRDGARGVWVFERDSAGRVSRLVNWRDNNAVVWRRVR